MRLRIPAMRPRGKLTVLLTALALFLGLAGCREKAPESAFDAKTYVEGRLAGTQKPYKST